MAGIAGLRFVAAAVLAAAVSVAVPAAAQDSTLERRLQGMLDSFERRFAAVDEQLRHLTSLVERLDRNQAEFSRETLGLVDEISLRLSELAVARPAAVIASPPQSGQSSGSLGILQIPAGEGGAVAGSGSVLRVIDPNDLLIDDLLDAVGGSAADEAALQGPNELYAAAQNLMVEFRLEEAIESFSEFIEHNPDHELASEAKYWLGEAYYGTENYNQAASTFLRLVREHRQSDRVSSSWLRIGMSLYNSGKPEAACQAYGEAAKFGDAAREDRERLQREQTRAGCI